MGLLTVEEVSNLLRVPRARAYELCREGLIPVVHLGRQVRIDEAQLRRWIELGGQALPGGWRRDSPGNEGQTGEPHRDRHASRGDQRQP